MCGSIGPGVANPEIDALEVMRASVLILALSCAVLAPASAQAEPLPLPLEPGSSTTMTNGSSGDGFSSTVETGLSDLTRLQCRMLGLLLINSQPCPAK